MPRTLSLLFRPLMLVLVVTAGVALSKRSRTLLSVRPSSVAGASRSSSASSRSLALRAAATRGPHPRWSEREGEGWRVTVVSLPGRRPAGAVTAPGAFGPQARGDKSKRNSASTIPTPPVGSGDTAASARRGSESSVGRGVESAGLLGAEGGRCGVAWGDVINSEGARG